MKKLIILSITLFLFSCDVRQENDMITIDHIQIDEFNITAEYHFYMGHKGDRNDYYIIDKAGLYKIGDTIFISSLRKNINELSIIK